MTANIHSTDSDDVELWIRDTGERVPFWSQYSYDQDFTTATDAFSFSMGTPELAKKYFPKLAPGTKVSLVINGKTQATGYVDKRKKSETRDGGTLLDISGRDAIAHLCDSGVDPLFKFSTKTTLNDVYEKVAKPFGVFRLISTTDIANRSVITGYLDANTKKLMSPPKLDINKISSQNSAGYTSQNLAVTQSVVGEFDPTKPRFLKDYAVDNIKPHPGEGCYEFLARLSKRFRLNLWSNAIGDELIVDAPDYAQRSSFTLYRRGASKNFLTGEYSQDATDQPTIVCATGMGAGGPTPYTPLKVMLINELTGYDSTGKPLPKVQEFITARKKLGYKLVPPRQELRPYSKDFTGRIVRPVFLHDDESKNFGQLEGWALYELCSRQAKAFEIKYRVRGHTQDGKPWAVNTMVDIEDDRLDLYGSYWLKSRAFTKSRTGAFTDLTLIPPHTLII